MPARGRCADLLLDEAGARGRGRVAVSGRGEGGCAKHARRTGHPFAPMARRQNMNGGACPIAPGVPALTLSTRSMNNKKVDADFETLNSCTIQ